MFDLPDPGDHARGTGCPKFLMDHPKDALTLF